VEIEIEAADGHRFGMRVFAAETNGPVVLFSPAMGVRAEKYARLGEAFADAGVTFCAIDLRGHGTSSVRAARRCDYGYREMVEVDLPAALAAVKARFPSRAVYLMGHSLGGQMSCLFAAAHPDSVDGVILTAACSVYYRNYHIRLRFRFLLTVMGTIVSLFGYFPGDRLRFARREGATVMRDWAYQGRTGRYRIIGSARDYEALLGAVPVPVLAVSMVGDLFAPPAAVDHLCAKLRRATVTREHLRIGDPSPGSAPHFTWLKHPVPIVAAVKDWLSE